ncbi:MAG TPA: BamA/TamA family outer membrane protein [Limnochordia bacterium]|nr:BamA/TamA family outer membrane protein [Limnochordia bacterium]
MKQLVVGGCAAKGRRLGLAAVLVLCFAGAPAAAAPAEPASTKAQQTSDANEVQPTVTAIAIRGNHRIDNATIFAAVTKTKTGERLDKKSVEADAKAVYDLGVFDTVEPALEAVPGGVRVVFNVTENPVITSVTVHSGVVDASKVKALFDVPTGEVLNTQKLRDAIASARDKIKEETGYILLLQPQNVNLAKDGTLTLDFDVARVGKIKIEGNKKTKDFVIMRELQFKSGDLLNVNKIQQSYLRLARLHFFDDVEVSSAADPNDPGKLDITFQVKEHKTGTASFGAVYSSAEGLLGYIQVSDDNFLGNGQQANVRWEFGASQNTYDIGFHEPYVFGTDTSAGFDIYKKVQRRTQIENDGSAHDYTDSRIGGSVDFGRPLTDTTNLSATYRLENTIITPKEPSGPIKASNNNTRSLTLAMNTDTTNSWLYPTQGYRDRLALELAGSALGGTTNYTKYEGQYSRYFKVGRNDQTLALRVGAGFADRPLPLSEEYHLGGSDTLRGYRFSEFSGDNQLLFNAEYRFKITKSVRGVIFTDWGNAWDYGTSLDKLHGSVGVGVNFDTPLGTMRLDYGVGEHGGQAYFSLGPSF